MNTHRIVFQEIPVAKKLGFKSIAETSFIWRSYSEFEVRQAILELALTGHILVSDAAGDGSGWPAENVDLLGSRIFTISRNASETGVNYEQSRQFEWRADFITSDLRRLGAIIPAALNVRSIGRPLSERSQVAIDVYWVIVKAFLTYGVAATFTGFEGDEDGN